MGIRGYLSKRVRKDFPLYKVLTVLLTIGLPDRKWGEKGQR